MRGIQLLRSLLLGLVLAGMASYTSSAATTILIEIDSVWSYEDSDTDLGTAWKEVGFDDSGWKTGAAALGFPAGENIPLTGVNTLIVRGDNPVTVTHYFRTSFNFSGDTAGVTLIASNLVDDGAVFYLNGVEVGRVAMPTGAITHDTTATRANDIGGTRIDVVNIPSDALVNGNNVFAVEVHQGSTTSSDMIFASLLVAEIPTDGPPVIVTQPLAQEVGQGDQITLRVTVDGTPPYTFQWVKDGEDIPGATGATYIIPSAGLGDEGNYSVRVTNGLGEALSDQVFVSVIEGPVTVVNFGSVWSYDDTDTNLGTGWREVNFDDSGWASGASPLGFPTGEALPANPNGGGNLMVETTLLRTVGNLTYYFRNEFNFEGEPLDFELQITTLLDDGAVIYLNGQELLRVGMPEGPVSASTQAGRSVGNASLETFTVPADLLRQGMNTLAVESHQINATSSDIIMGLRIVAQPLPPTRIGIVTQPESLSVEELKPASFTVEIVGNTPRFQWFRIDGSSEPVAIPGATRPTYTIESTMLSDNMARFFVVVSNVINRVESEIVTLEVIPDTVAPMILVADGTIDNRTVIVSFDEPLDQTTAESISNYEIDDSLGEMSVNVTSAVLTNMTNVILTTSGSRASDKNWILTVNNVRDIAPTPNTIAPDSRRPITSLLELVRLSSQWQYWDPDPIFDEYPLIGPEWYTDPNFDVADLTPDGAYFPWFWRTGNGAFGDNGPLNELPEEIRSTLSQTVYITTQFRTTFSFDGAPSGAKLRLRHLVDDGAIFWLNGEEILRFNMPAGTINSNTPASAVVGAGSFNTVDIPVTSLLQGENLIAVQLHQTSIRDIDKLFALELIATVDSLVTGPVVITSRPADQEAIEGDSVTFSFVGVAGTEFQWRKNGVAISGATNATYTVDSVTLADNNSLYSVLVSNPENSVASGDGRLTVLPDMTPPDVVSAQAIANGVVITFTEPISASSGNNTANYAVMIDRGGSRAVVGAVTAPDGLTVTLTLNETPAIGDTVLVSNIADASTAANVMPNPSLFSIGFGGLILDYDAEFRYDASDTDLGVDWRDTGYDDSSWDVGPGLFGEEGASLPRPIQTVVAAPQTNPNPPTDGPIVSYYRTTFNLAVLVDTILLSHIIDDGAVFYINGQEVYRIGVPAGQGHTTLASRTVGNAVEEGPFTVAIPPGLLSVGDNTLAVEMHQSSTGSSDTVFGARMELETVPSVRILVPPIPTLSIEESPAAPGFVRISWVIEEGEFFLERSVSVNGPWAPFPLSVTAPPNTFIDQRVFPRRGVFYRLRQNR